MTRFTVPIAVALALATVGCKPKAPAAEAPPTAKELDAAPPERVMTAIRALKTSLGKRLKAELEAKGSAAAVDICKLDAPTLTAAQVEF